jgi:hypothetical protein
MPSPLFVYFSESQQFYGRIVSKSIKMTYTAASTYTPPKPFPGLLFLFQHATKKQIGFLATSLYCR